MFITYELLYPILIIFLLIHIAVPGRVRSTVMLIFSMILYLMSGTAAFYILPAAGILAYGAGILLEEEQSRQKRKLIFVIATVLLCGFLFIFRFTSLKVVAPLGMSFFILEAISYMSDCYHGRIKAERNPIYVILYISFFPTITSGPIERGGNLIPQFRKLDEMSRRELFDINRLCDNAIIIIYGMFVKFVIADRLKIVADQVFGQFYTYGTVVLIIGAVCFGMQLYCDFMAYSHIAIGVAGLFGVKVMENFKAPYTSASPSEFWRKWHISLSSWLRDYVYIPLGGNRKGRIRKYINVFITFVVSGLWHGSGLSFLIWGGLHGLYVMTENILRDVGLIKRDNSVLPFGKRALRALLTFVLVDFAWIFFRADSAMIALKYIKQMFTVGDFWILSDMDKLFSLGIGVQEGIILTFALLILFGIDYISSGKDMRIDRWLNLQGPVFRVIFTLFLLLYTIVFGIYGSTVDPGTFYYMSF